MKPRQRWLIIGSLLLATLAAGTLLDDRPAPARAGKGAKPAHPASAVAATGTARAQADKLDPAPAPLSFPEPAAGQAPDVGTTVDPFRATSWLVAPPSPPPAKPVAPPLPFQYLGKVDDGAEVRVFLDAQGRHLIATTGDVINDVYRVEAISGSQMTFVYLPLKEKQLLSIGSDR